MDHQDFTPIILNSKSSKKNQIIKKEKDKKVSQLQNNIDDIKIEADKKLGQILSQARIAKGFNKQSDFVNELNKIRLNISIQIYNKWESNKEVPTNEQIAKMEKLLGIQLPRNKKIKIIN